MPGDRALGAEGQDLAPQRLGRAVVAELHEPILDPDQAAAVEDLVEVDGRGGVAADDDDGELRRVPVLLPERGDVGGDGRPDVRGDRPALEQERGARRRRASGHDGGRPRGRGARAALDVRPGRLGRAPRSRRGASPTRPRSSSASTSSPSDGRLTRTFSAAPWADASTRREATARSLAALRLLRPASASAARPRPRGRPRRVRSGTSRGHARRGPDRRAAGRLLLVRLARQLEGGGEGRVGIRVLVGEREQAGGQLAPGRPVAGVAGGVRARTSGDRAESDATIATSAAPHEAATAEAAPPPGLGVAEPRSSMNPSRVMDPKRGAVSLGHGDRL